jgi:putative tricarboxylic transport membrane protein
MGKAEKISALITVAFGIFVMAYSYYSLKLGMMITPGAGFLPFFIGIALVILGVLWFIQKSMKKSEVCVPLMEDTCVTAEEPSEAADLIAGMPRKMVLGLAVLIVYAILFERIGYFLATLIFMFAWQRIVEKERWLKSLLITAIATMTMYSLFRYLLNVPLPKGPWF